ncbi:MAG: transglycosylase domain-containing protein, partial [Sphingobacterium sp.]
MKKKWFIISLAGLVLLIASGIIWGLSVRGAMLEKAVNQVKNKLKTDYHLNFQVQDYKFSGLSTVHFSKIRLTPDSMEQLAAIERFEVSVNLLPLILGNVTIGDMEIDSAVFTLVKQSDNVANYDFLFRKNNQTDSTEAKSKEVNLSERVDHLLKQVFQKVPKDLSMEKVSLSYQDSVSKQAIHIPVAKVSNGRYDIDVFLNENEDRWNFKGKINAGKQTLNLTVSAADKDAEVPFLRHKYGLLVRFDELNFHLDQVAKKGKDALEIKGGWSAENLRVFHDRLSEEQIVLPAGLASGGLLISENTIELIKGTKVKVKDFVFEPQLKFQKNKGRVIDLAVHTGQFRAQDFFDALPKGLFENLAGIQVEGDIQYDLDFHVNLDHPDSLRFNSNIADEQLKIKQWGKADIAALNGPYQYQAFEDSAKMRDILLSPENPNFTPLALVSPIVKKTVLNTEDPFFYEHNGFELEAFQLSILTNIKEKQFKRGASTISMQLIKNLYLNRNKTMMRKFEEILLVWLMEQSHAVSKDRLFEIYLNIIEWGKNIYGISEAAHYYFGKKPNELTIGESLFLSSIIPRPKTGLSSFDYTGHLKPWVLKHFNTYGSIMNKRNQLDDEAVPANYGFYQVELEQKLRPARPKGVVDSALSHDNIKDMVKEIDQEESIRKALI